MSQSIEKLRRKVMVKSEEAELFKKKYIKQVLENESLLRGITRLKDLLHTREAKITALEAIIRIREMQQRASETKKTSKIPFIKETKHALFCAEHAVVDTPINFSEVKDGKAIKENITEGEVAFSSRFMPNVTFVFSGILNISGTPITFKKLLVRSNYCMTDNDGTSFSVFKTKLEYLEEMNKKEVSVYEAIPELVPEGMVYDKEIDACVSCIKKSE